MSGNRQSISGLQNIMSYLNRLSDEKVTGIIRPFEDKKLGVKFRFGRTKFREKPYGLQFIGISDYGLTRLSEHRKLKIEIFGRSKRITFDCQLLKVLPHAIWVSVPTAVIEAERRDRQRFQTDIQNIAYFNPKSWVVDGNDIAAPPVFGLYQSQASWATISDISYGGICVETRFPSLLNWLDCHPICDESELVLPMKEPLLVPTELRWSKRIRERVSEDRKSNLSIQKYRFGLMFLQPTNAALEAVSDFIKTLELNKAC